MNRNIQWYLRTPFYRSEPIVEPPSCGPPHWPPASFRVVEEWVGVWGGGEWQLLIGLRSLRSFFIFIGGFRIAIAEVFVNP